MSNLSISSLATDLYQAYLNRNQKAQTAQNLTAVGTALQSGDLPTAQSALTTFEQGLPSTSASTGSSSAATPFGDNAQANTDFQSLTAAVQSNNLTDAQTAFANLQTSLKAGHAHKGHHHGGGGAPPPTDTATTSGSGNEDGSGIYVNVTV